MRFFNACPRGSNGPKGVLRLVVATTAISLAAACGAGGTAAGPRQEPEQTYTATTVTPAVLHAGQAVPLPKKPILTLRGAISTTNDGRVLELGADTLDQMGVFKVRVYEPFAKKQVTFQGVWLADVLKVAGVEKSARGVHLTALDDYQVDLTTMEVEKGGIFLATKSADGSPIPVDDGGPTRIVFMDGVKAGQNEDQWIWSLKTLDVR